MTDTLEHRKRIARWLVEKDPALLTLEKLDTLIEKYEEEREVEQQMDYLERMDRLGKMSDDEVWTALWGSD
jgi:hypothetical protein